MILLSRILVWQKLDISLVISALFVMRLLKRVTIYFICVNMQKNFGNNLKNFGCQ